MAGKYTSVHKDIKRHQLKTEFVARTNHFLNLAGIHATSFAVNSVAFERLFTFFSAHLYFCQHWRDILISVTGQCVKCIIETQ